MRNLFATACRRALFAVILCAGLLALSNVATAQLCQPCSSGASYRIIVGPNWDARLGYANVTVDVQDMTTAVVTQQYHNQIAAPDTIVGTFPTTHPGRNYGITNITLNTLLGTIYWVYCDPSGPVCYPIGNPAVWIKFTFTSGPSPYCYTIQMEKVAGPC